MAKQRGLHQIKGKVGEYSYYSQTGVSGGLIRKINEGLSARVKTDAAYANTRLNNQEFGAAADTASLLGKTVVPKFRPMILPFSQSRMAKEVLRVAREHTANWGQRVVTSEDTAKLCDILTSMSKLSAADWFDLSFTGDIGEGELTVSAGISAENATLLNSLGISAVNVSVVQYNIATGQWSPLGQIMATGYYERKNSVSIEIPVNPGQSDSDSEDMVVSLFTPEANHSGHQILVFVCMPYRQINSTQHILQEYCSFVAMPIPLGD